MSAAEDVFNWTVRLSYEGTLRRLEAAEARIRHLLTLAPAVLLAIALPTITISRVGPDSTPPPLNVYAIVAVALLGVMSLLGLTFGFRRGHRFPNPAEASKDYMARAKAVHEDAVAQAGKDFEDNCRTIEQKGRIADCMSILLFCATCLGIVWVTTVV